MYCQCRFIVDKGNCPYVIIWTNDDSNQQLAVVEVSAWVSNYIPYQTTGVIT